MKTALCAVLAAVLLGEARAAEPKRFFEMSRPEIAGVLRDLHDAHPDLADRIGAVSERFLGTPYRLGPLGEGSSADFDRDPLFSFKEADCTTFIEHVMALSLKRRLPDAMDALTAIRYQGGRVGYLTRNHFPEVDWIPNNKAAGFLEDITREIAGEKTGQAVKVISKRRWYESKTIDDLAGFSGLAPKEKEARLKRLRVAGVELKDETASVAYLPMELLPEALGRIPSGTIANLVREDAGDKPVLISHQALLIRKDGGVVVRHAASGAQVEDVPALEYFYRYYNSKWRLVGLNLNRIRSK